MTTHPNRKLRLDVLVSSLTIGGAEQLLLTLLRAVDRSRLDIQIIFLREPGILGEEFLRLGFPTVTRLLGGKFDMGGIFRLARIFSTRRTDALLLINHRNTLFFGVPAARIAGVPVVVNWENETYLRYTFHRLTMLGRRILHLGIDKVVAAAMGHRDYIARVEKIPYRKIVPIYNGVDPGRFTSRLTAGEAKRRLGIPVTSPVVSIIAVLRPDKAHEDFLAAAAHVMKRRPDVHFLVIGDGPRRAALEALANELELSENVHFLGFRRRLGDILAAVDINTLSSRPQQETLSVAAIEAMSAGIPMICTDVGFMREIVRDGETGYIVDVGAPRQMAERICHLLDRPWLLADLKRRAAAQVREKLTVRTMAARFEALFYRTYLEKCGHAGRTVS